MSLSVEARYSGAVCAIRCGGRVVTGGKSRVLERLPS
jgi:hypothetical protein